MGGSMVYFLGFILVFLMFLDFILILMLIDLFQLRKMFKEKPLLYCYEGHSLYLIGRVSKQLPLPLHCLDKSRLNAINNTPFLEGLFCDIHMAEVRKRNKGLRYILKTFMDIEEIKRLENEVNSYERKRITT